MDEGGGAARRYGLENALLVHPRAVDTPAPGGVLVAAAPNLPVPLVPAAPSEIWACESYLSLPAVSTRDRSPLPRGRLLELGPRLHRSTLRVWVPVPRMPVGVLGLVRVRRAELALVSRGVRSVVVVVRRGLPSAIVVRRRRVASVRAVVRISVVWRRSSLRIVVVSGVGGRRVGRRSSVRLRGLERRQGCLSVLRRRRGVPIGARGRRRVSVARGRRVARVPRLLGVSAVRITHWGQRYGRLGLS